MANYHITPTAIGAALIAKCLAENKSVSFSSIQLGSGEAPAEDLSLVTALAKVEKTLAIAAITRKGPEVTCTAKLDFTEIAEDFQWKEVALIAKDPDTQEDVLICYGNAGGFGDWITGGVAATAKNINITTLVSTDVNVTAVIDNTKTYALIDLSNVASSNMKEAIEKSGALDRFAPLDSPALTGTPTAPTAQENDSSTQIATTAFVNAAIIKLIGAAPGALDTLEELAQALGDDPNFATTMTNLIATKAPLDSPALTGTPTAPTPESGDSSTRIATTEFVSGAVETGSEYTNMLDKLAYETQLHGYVADYIKKGGILYVATPADDELPHLGLKDQPFRSLQEAFDYLPADLHGRIAVIHVLSRVKTTTAESSVVYTWAAPDNAYQQDAVMQNVRNGSVWIEYGELAIDETAGTMELTAADGDAQGKLGRIKLCGCDRVYLKNFHLNCNFSTEEHEEGSYYPAVILSDRSLLYLEKCTITEGDIGAWAEAGSGFFLADHCAISNLTGCVMFARTGTQWGVPNTAELLGTLTLTSNAYFAVIEGRVCSVGKYISYETYYNLDLATGQLSEVQCKHFNINGEEVDPLTGEPLSA